MLRHGFITALCLLTAAAHAMATDCIELRESASVEGRQIMLAEIADEVPEALAEVDLGPAPLPGDSRRVSVGYVKMRLRRAGVDCSALVFRGPDEVEVHRMALPAVPLASADDEAEDIAPGEQQQRAVPVRRGSRLHLTVIRGAVVIGAEAVLLEDATTGAMARLRVEQTRETVVARIVREAEALICRK